ncbi:MAG: DUF4097 family beta strand repeat-containing protein [Chloroflexota bacterium]|nr:DUF4097 family beta strand repeat-containing protein [Chloroflexota bacterium]
MPTFVRSQAISHPVGERGRVSLKVTSADVQLSAAPGGDASIRATFEIKAASEKEADDIFEQVRLRVKQSPGELLIEEPDITGSFGSVISRIFGSGVHGDLNVEARVPAGVELRLSGVSADMEVSGMRGDQRYHTVSGDLSVTEAGGRVRLNTISGDATLRATEPLAVEAQGVSGDLSVIAPQLESLRVSTVSGDVELEGELSARGDFRVETVSGDLVVGLLGSATFEVRGLSTDVNSELDHRLEGRSDRRRLIVGAGGPTLVFNSMSGDVSVRRPRRVSPARGDATAATPPTAPAASPDAASRLDVLQALERGEIDVDEASRRLAGGS